MGSRRVSPRECSGGGQSEQCADLPQAKTLSENCGERAHYQHHGSDTPGLRLAMQMSGKPDAACECQSSEGEWGRWAWLCGSHLVFWSGCNLHQFATDMCWEAIAPTGPWFQCGRFGETGRISALVRFDSRTQSASAGRGPGLQDRKIHTRFLEFPPPQAALLFGHRVRREAGPQPLSLLSACRTSVETARYCSIQQTHGGPHSLPDPRRMPGTIPPRLPAQNLRPSELQTILHLR